VTDCAFVSNRVYGLGGGLAIDLGVDLTLEGSTFEGNTAGSGGGIAVSAASAAVTGCDVVGNTATFGGGLCFLSATGTEVVDSVIASNTADYQGGGVYSADSSYEVRGSAFTSNVAGEGGGALWLLGSTGILTRTAVVDNSTAGLAGGLFIDASPTTISSCELTGNGLAVHVVTPPRALVDARMNWWGSSTGPYHPTLNPSGLGDEVSDSVLFAPWNVTAGAPEHPGVVRSTWGAIKAIHR
jgi:hypothetical protein